MEIKGKIKQINQSQNGTSAKGEWVKREFVITTSDTYPKDVCFEVWKSDVVIPEVGQDCNVHINAESREWNGRWYTSLTAWKIDCDTPSNTPSDTPSPQAEPEPIGDDSLPF